MTEPLPVDHPLLAVVAPPRVPALRARLGLTGDDLITANFTGWCKLVLLTEELAICVPRDHTLVEPLHREIAALGLLTKLGIPAVPALREVIEDPEIGPLPILVCERLPGVPLADVLDEVPIADLARLFDDLGQRAARWHDAPIEAATHLGTRDGFGPVVAFAASLDLSADERRWTDRAVEIAGRLDRVLVHGDIHEGQLLVDPDPPHELTGILDWQTARVDHPFVDFDLGEWGTEMWRGHRRSFPELRRRAWIAYATARDIDPEVGAALEWFHACSHARRLVGDGSFPVVHPPEVVGTPAEARTAITAALHALAELAP
jgi:aminoglycoside phosphotransferase (APT) family kinase protein